MRHTRECKAILLFCCVGWVAALSSYQIPYGVVIVPNGNAKLFVDTYEAVIVRSHPRVIVSNLLAELKEQLRSLISHMGEEGDNKNLNVIYKRRFINLNRPLSRSKRWAPLEPLGEVTGSLFGLTTARESREMRSRINTIIDALGTQERIIRGFSIAINDTMHNQDIIQDTVASLTKRAKQVQKLMNQARTEMSDLERSLSNVQGYMLVESILSLFETYKSEERFFERTFKLTRDLAEIGHVTEDLISSTQLRNILKDINSPLTPSYIYRNFKVQLLSVSPSRIAYVFNIPQLKPETYSAWQVTTAPYLSHSAHLRIQPELLNIGVEHESGLMLDTSNCLYENPMICNNAIIYSHLPCIQGILARNAVLVPTCSVFRTNISNPAIYRINRKQLLLSSATDVITERCLNKPPIAHKILSGANLLTLNNNCTISSENYHWSCSLGATTTSTIEENSIVYLEGMNINLSIPVVPTPPDIEWSHLKGLSNLTNGRLPQLDRILQIPHLKHSHHFIVVSMIIFITMLAGISVIISYYYRGALRKLCRCHETVPEIAVDPSDTSSDSELAPPPTTPLKAKVPVATVRPTPKNHGRQPLV